MPKHLSKYVLIILGLCSSVQAWANPTDVLVEINPRPPTVIQPTDRGLSRISIDELTEIASFLNAGQISRLARTKKDYIPLFREALLSTSLENENQFKAEFISAFKNLQKQVFQEITNNQILLDLNKLKNFNPEFFSYSQLYVFTKLYHFLAFRRSSLNRSDPSLDEFYSLSETCYPLNVENELAEFDRFFDGCDIGGATGFILGVATGFILGDVCSPTKAIVGLTLGAAIGGLHQSKSVKSFLFNSCLLPTLVASATVSAISHVSVVIYDYFCPLDPETFPGSYLDHGRAKKNKDRTKLSQISPNIRKVPIVYSILKPFISEWPPTEDERARINRDIQLLGSIPQMREVLVFAGAIDWSQQITANEGRIDILSDDDQPSDSDDSQPSDSDDSSDSHSPALESQLLLRRR